MTLVLKPGHLQAMREHARSTYPEECIGVLGGTVRDDGEKTVMEVRAFANAQPESRTTRSLIPPEDYLKLDREYRKRALKMVAFYHSHPDHPCKPSEFDRENALPWHSYVIVKVDRGEPVEITSWVLQEDRGGFDSEPIKTQFDLDI